MISIRVEACLLVQANSIRSRGLGSRRESRLVCMITYGLELENSMACPYPESCDMQDTRVANFRLNMYHSMHVPCIMAPHQVPSRRFICASRWLFFPLQSTIPKIFMYVNRQSYQSPGQSGLAGPVYGVG